mmetsp:Transcript_11236/g.18570  ORF Transcript_11236/g.18570 Transcript_11236/m.18570 type:complete len:434 (+) Transcript_11236:94-1395(+)|eukprot:scaffold28932_cov143-Skeletonema_menzelii.AAC.5
MTDDEKKDSTAAASTPKDGSSDSPAKEEPSSAAEGASAAAAGSSTAGEGPAAGFGAMPGANPMMMGQFNNSMMGSQLANMMGGFSTGDGNAQLAAQAMMRKRQMEMSGDDFAPTVGAKRAKAESESAALKQAVADASASPSDLPQQTPIPPSKEGIKFYSRNDVLCGRGGGTNVHPGNRRFRDLINANRRAYLKARKNDKPAISRSIVRTIREMNGRFLKKDEKQGLWFEIGDDGAREKTSQALRQRAPEMRKILFEDEQRQQQAQQEAFMQRQFMMQGQMPGMMGQMNGMNRMGMHPGMMGGMNPMGGMMPPPMPSMGMAGMNAENFAAMPSNMTGGMMGGMMGGMTGSMPTTTAGTGPSAAEGANGAAGGEDPQAMMAKYNMLHQKNLLAQEKAMLMQRLAGISNQQNNIESMSSNGLLSQGNKPPTPRGA